MAFQYEGEDNGVVRGSMGNQPIQIATSALGPALQAQIAAMKPQDPNAPSPLDPSAISDTQAPQTDQPFSTDQMIAGLGPDIHAHNPDVYASNEVTPDQVAKIASQLPQGQPAAAPQVQSKDEPGHIDPSQLALNPPPAPNGALMPGQDFLKSWKAAGAQEIQGIKDQAAAASAEAQAHVKAIDDITPMIKQQQARELQLQDQQKQYVDTQMKTVQNLSDQVSQAAQIDPNRIYHNMATGSKITAGISIALGAIGGALTGQGGNAAMDVINKAIDRDLEAQKLNYQQKQNTLTNQMSVFNIGMKSFGDQRIATEAARSAYLQQAQLQVQAAVAKFGGAGAQARGEILTGQLKQQQIQSGMTLQVDMQKRAIIMQAQGGGGVDPSVLPFIGKDYEERAVAMPNGKSAFAYSSKDAEEIKKKAVAANNYMKTLDQIEDLQKQSGVSIPHSIASEKSMSLMAQLEFESQALEGLTRLSAEDRGLLKHEIPDATAFRSERSKALIGLLRKHGQDAMESEYKNRIPGYKSVNVGPAR